MVDDTFLMTYILQPTNASRQIKKHWDPQNPVHCNLVCLISIVVTIVVDGLQNESILKIEGSDFVINI